MVTAGLVCVGVAVLTWPCPPRAAAGSAVGRRRRGRSPIGATRLGGLGTALVVGGAVLMLAIVWTAIGALAVAVVTTTAAFLVRSSATDRRHRRDLVELAAALRMVGRELRAGASPEQAIAVCIAAIGGGGDRTATRPGASSGDPVTDSPGAGPAGTQPSQPLSVTVRVLQELVLPGDPRPDRALPVDRERTYRAAAWPGRSHRPRPVDDLVVRLVGGWRLAMRCGLPLTSLIEGVTAVAQERVDALDARRAEVAGPRLSGWVLAALPVMGLLLGSGMGADPLALLLAPNGPGPVLLLVGLTLTCVGLWWSARIVRR